MRVAQQRVDVAPAAAELGLLEVLGQFPPERDQVFRRVRRQQRLLATLELRDRHRANLAAEDCASAAADQASVRCLTCAYPVPHMGVRCVARFAVSLVTRCRHGARQVAPFASESCDAGARREAAVRALLNGGT